MAIIAVLALLGIAAVYENMRTRIAANDAQFAAMQRLRLQRTQERVGTLVSDSEQFLLLGAQSAAAVSGDLALARMQVAEMFRARRDKDVFGMGMFFQPYAFDPHREFISVYDRDGVINDKRYDTLLSDGVVQVMMDGPAYGPSDDYTKWPWYRAAMKNPEQTVVIGPYYEDHETWVSLLRSFKLNGKLDGVFAVDLLYARVKTLLSADLAPGDVLWVQGPKVTWLLGTSLRPPDPQHVRREAVLPGRTAGVVFHLSSDASAAIATDRRFQALSIGLMLLLALLATIAMWLLLQRWQREEETAILQGEQVRLEHEVDVARRVEAELRHIAYIDGLTGLPNRAAFMDRVRELMRPSGGSPPHAIFLVDLDRFNIVNETIGHPGGDELLRALAVRFSSAFPVVDVARLGGDEFAVVAPFGEQTSKTIAELIAEPVVVAGQIFRMNASMGIVLIDGSYERPEDLLRDADIAMYEAKGRGRARSATFDTTMRTRVARESELEADLRRAIERSEFTVHYQPLIRIETGEVAGFEALVRWQRAGETTISAGEFIPFAEARGLISAIDANMLRTVCSHASLIDSLFPGAQISANISVVELASRDLADSIERLLRDHSIAADRLKLEITETAMMLHADAVAHTIERLREIGIALVLDDFGTGYSSLAYLKRLSISGLKIDRTFVENIDRDERALEVVRSIVAIATSFGLDTTAEGVEGRAQLEILARLGVTFAQGHLFSEALPIGSLSAFRTEHRPQQARVLFR
ncbi:MAG TPA: EAL domain-containing protein [Candidatus Acidoferrales bacterium]|nr:EAL domain-containing protein [Candidatus Acidoferrales bacterium]